MRLGPIEINLASSKPKTQTKTPSTNVYKYPVMTQSQVFASYKNVTGSQALSFDLIDGLYSNSIMNRIIQKLAGDTTRMNYSVTCTDFEGKRIEEIELLTKQIDVKITRSVLRAVVRDMLKYGTGFLYIQYDKGTGIPIQTYTVHPQYLTPVIENGALTKWKYRSQGTETELLPEELIAFPLDPQTGELFGNSIFGPIIQILELILNSQQNTAILIDRFAIPIIHWLVSSGLENEGVKIEPEEIQKFLNSLVDQLDVGSDIATDALVDSKVIGTDADLIDFTPIIQNLQETFGITVGVPLMLIGARGDNLSISRMQFQSYLEHLRDIQETISDILTDKVYRPYLETQGYIQSEDYFELYLNFPVMSVEEGSKTATWLFPAVREGFIDRTEARNALGYKGAAVPIEDIEVPSQESEVIRPGARKDPTEEPEEETPQEPNDAPDRKHEPTKPEER
jgi:predicted RNA-binding protein Jag